MLRQRTSIAALVAALLAAPLASGASAQGTTATIVGAVMDSSGGALPGSTVTARNADTGLTRSVPSGADGAYRIEFLPIGNYVVEAALDGFKTMRRTGIVLRASDTVRVDVSLRRDREHHRGRRDRGAAARRPQRLFIAGSDARRAIEQQRHRRGVDRHQLARARLSRAAHDHQRRRRRRHRLGELLPRRRHQHDRTS